MRTYWHRTNNTKGTIKSSRKNVIKWNRRLNCIEKVPKRNQGSYKTMNKSKEKIRGWLRKLKRSKIKIHVIWSKLLNWLSLWKINKEKIFHFPEKLLNWPNLWRINRNIIFPWCRVSRVNNCKDKNKKKS